MPKLTVINRAGEARDIITEAEVSVMEVIRDAGIEELAAICGGCCSCATCHVHVDPAYLAKLPDMGEMENDLLDVSEHRNETSRLSCQVTFTRDLDGMTVTIAEED